jgi:AraC family transcriptional regulator
LLLAFHFHRVFKGITGETLLDFVQRTRLERAARALYLNQSASVIQIALEYGYENQSSFAKAFKRHFRTSASQWRKSAAKVWIQERQKAKIAQQSQISKNGKEANPEVWQKLSTDRAEPLPEPGKATVRDLLDLFVVLRRYIGPYGSPQITGVWHELMRWADAKGLIDKDTTSLGVVRDDPFSTQPERCRYDACVAVPGSFTTTDPDYRVETVTGGRYLHYHFVGRSTDVDRAWDRVYREWLPESGYQPDDRPNLELYRPGSILDPVELTFHCELCVPVRSL